MPTGGPCRQDAAPGDEVVGTTEFADAEPAAAGAAGGDW
jgi:hypothetical protein